MADCHVESWQEQERRSFRPAAYRAAVICTATGTTLYTTWPYGSELSAQQRAKRWMNKEYARQGQGGLFQP